MTRSTFPPRPSTPYRASFAGRHFAKWPSCTPNGSASFWENDGAAWAELANDVVTVVGGQADGQRFRQVELEIASRGSDIETGTRAVVKALRRAGARPDPHPKLEKVLGPPDCRPRMGRRSSAEDLVRQAVSDGFERLVDHDWRIRVAGPDVDAEDVHQARVATRRLRSDLGTLAPLLDPLWVGHVRDDLRWAADALGAVRDLDVLAQSLSKAGAGSALMETLADERTSAVQALRQTLSERRYLDLLDRLHAASVTPPITNRRLAARKGRRVLPALVNRRWKKLRRDARKAGRRPSDDQLHQLRKRSKQLRYASELAAPLVGKAAKRTAKASEALQTVLGDHHDAVVATEWLSKARASNSADTVVAVDSLITCQDRRRNRLGRKWQPRYKELGKPGRRGWLHKR